MRNFQKQDLDALNYLDDPIWVFDIVRRSMFWANDAAVALWSADSLDSLLARSFKDMSEATQFRLDAYLERFLQNETIQEQWTFYPNGSETIVVDCVFKGISIEEGRLAMLTTGKKMEHKSENVEENIALRATEMMRQLPVAAYLMDLSGNILEQNPESLAVFGSIPKQDDSNAFCKRFVDPNIGENLLKQCCSDSNSHKDVSIDALQHTVHGTQWSSIKIRRTRDPVNCQPVLLCTARDVTNIMEENKKNAVSSPTSNKHLQSLQDMALAMRPLLQHIFGVVELLVKQSNTENECHSMLLTTTQMLMKIVDNFTSASSGMEFNADKECLQKDVLPPPCEFPGKLIPNAPKAIKLECQPLDLRQVLAKAVKNTQELQIRTVIFSRSINNGTAGLMGDAQKLQNVFQTLLQQASNHVTQLTVGIKRLPSKGRKCRIRLEFKVRGVKNNNNGGGGDHTTNSEDTSSQQQQNNLPLVEWDTDDVHFQQEQDAMFECQTSIQAMGGELTCVETRPSHDGLWVCLDVPFTRQSSNKLKASRKSKLNTTPLETVPDGKGGMAILLVDEDTPSRNVLATLLEESGHTVTLANHGDAMIQSVLSGDLDAVLVETQLTNESSCTTLEAAAQLRTLGFSPEALPLIALTSLPPPSNDFAELGLNGWLTKPVLVRDIQKAITNAICNTGGRSMSGSSLGSTTFNDYDDSTICTAPSLYKELQEDIVCGNGNGNNGGPPSRGSSSPGTSQDSTPVMPPRRGSFTSSKAGLVSFTSGEEMI